MSERIEVPTFAQLGADGTTPLGSSWGVFGTDDERGTLNFLTPQATVRAAARVTEGVAVSLNWRNDLPEPAILGRGATVHHRVGSELGFTDDWFDGFYPQRSSQWDALLHARHPEHGYYNGIADADVVDGTRLGVQNLANPGISGRFILVDVARFRAAAGTPLDLAGSSAVTAEELEQILDAQGTVQEPGDIVLVHFGWTSWYEGLDDDARRALGGGAQFGSPGLAPTRDTAEWLWDHQVAAIAADVPSLETMPIRFDDPESILHFRLIPLLGYCVGELLELGALAATCARLGRYDGLLVAAPLNQPGGAGSPANAVALV